MIQGKTSFKSNTDVIPHVHTNLANSGAGSPNVGGISWLDLGTSTELPPPVDNAFLLRV